MLMLMVIIHVSSFHLGVDLGVPVLEMALAEGERQTGRRNSPPRSLWPAHTTISSFHCAGFVITNVSTWLMGSRLTDSGVLRFGVSCLRIAFGNVVLLGDAKMQALGCKESTLAGSDSISPCNLLVAQRSWLR